MKFFLLVFLFFLPFTSNADTQLSDRAEDFLVEVKMEGIICDLMYTKSTNFTGKQIYQNANHCFVHKNAIDRLKIEVKFASVLGYKIKIADSFRLIEVQQTLWDRYPDDNFVSNPANTKVRLGHCRGASIDLTLLDAKTGLEISMGTPIDYVGEKAYVQNADLSENELRNRVILTGINEYSWI